MCTHIVQSADIHMFRRSTSHQCSLVHIHICGCPENPSEPLPLTLILTGQCNLLCYRILLSSRRLPSRIQTIDSQVYF